MTTPVSRPNYGLNCVTNALLNDPAIPYSGEPDGWTVTTGNGNVEYENTWDVQDGFSGTPKQIVVHSLDTDNDAYVKLTSKKYPLEPVYWCNKHVEQCHYMRYRLEFEYMASDTQILSVKYYNFVKALLRTDNLTLPAEAEPTIYITTLDVPESAFKDKTTAYVQFTFTTISPMSYIVANIRFNQFLFADIDIPPEPVVPYAADRMEMCFSSDVYDITALDAIHVAVVGAVASEIDKARSMVLTSLNNLYLAYMNEDLIDEIGALMNMPRYTFEDDRDYLYRLRLGNIWEWGYGGGCQKWIKNFLQYFIDWDITLTNEAMEPEGALVEWERKKDVVPYADAVSDCDLLDMVRNEVPAGVFAAGDYEILPADVSKGGCDPDGAWVGNGVGVDAGSLVSNRRGK